MGSPPTVYPASPASAALLLTPGAALLDVRSRDAFAGGHLLGAGHIEPQDFLQRRAELPPREPDNLLSHRARISINRVAQKYGRRRRAGRGRLNAHGCYDLPNHIV